MSDAVFLIDQITGESNDTFDPVLLSPRECSFISALGPHSDIDVSNPTPAPVLPGISEGREWQGASYRNQSLGKNGSPCLLNPAYEVSSTGLNPAVHSTSALSQVVNQTEPRSLSPLEDPPKMLAKAIPRPEKRNRGTKEQPSSGTAAKYQLEQPKRESTTATNKTNKIRSTKTTKHERERNRAAAFTCRKRKKEWTESLRQKKSDLEALHSNLQTEYMNLFQESSRLKNYIICHATCHDPNIDAWIENEASKYVRKLSNEQPVNSKKCSPSLEVIGSEDTPTDSWTSSQCTERSQTCPGLEREDLDVDVLPEVSDAFEGDIARQPFLERTDTRA